MIHLERSLPRASFVPFAVRRLAAPRVMWTNPRHCEVADPASLAYCIPAPDEAESSYAAGERIALGERYGGGVANGGGVRCGLLDGLSIKGIGKNPLAGDAADFWHSHGGSSMEEGLREAIWGEICADVLPLGGTRVHAIIDAGTEIPYDSPAGPRRARRTLIVRDAVLRPAHFMRAIHFRTRHPDMAVQPSDASRTEQAIRRLPQSLASALALPEGGSELERLNLALLSMAGRMALQMAAARAARIMHGAINSQNIGLDGGWLDFGTVSAVSDYGRIIIARHSSDFLNDHAPLASMFGDLSHYLRRYLPQPLRDGVVGAAQLASTFSQTFEQRVAVEFVKLSGIPEELLAQVDPALLADFHAALVRIAGHGLREPFKLSPDHEPAMPARMGAFHLNTVLAIAAGAADAARMDAALRAELPHAGERARFVAAQLALRHACEQGLAPGRRGAARLFFALNAARLNSPLASLYRPNLDAAVAAALAAQSPFGPFIETLAAEARARRAAPRGGVLDLAAWAGPGWAVSLADGVLRDGAAASPEACIESLATGLLYAVRREELELLCRTPS